MSLTKVFFLIALPLIASQFCLAQDGLDRVPAMSGQVEIMDQLGLIAHESPMPSKRHKKMQKVPKNSTEKIRMHRLADMNSSAD